MIPKMAWRDAVAAAIVVAGLLGLEVAYGAPLGDAVLYLGYEVSFIVIPGWLTYRALSELPGGPLRQLAIGWGLGYVLEVLAFMATAATGTRGLFAAYPLAVAGAAVAVIRRRGGARPAEDPDALEDASGRGHIRWLLAAVILLGLIYIALSYFPGAPLPGTKRSLTYFPDDPRWISLAADAKHHWPIQDPSVAGEPLPYHYFVNVHLAAASQVTGLGLPLIYFRLFMLPLITLLVLEFVVAGQSFARSKSAGLIAAGLALFVSQLRLDTRRTFFAHNPFLGLFFTFLFRSPSFLFGLVILMPLLDLLGQRVSSSGTGRTRDWAVITLLLIGASDAKVAILPLLIGALLLYGVFRWAVERQLPSTVALAGALALLVTGTVYFLQYKGHVSRLGVHPFSAFDMMPAVQAVKSDVAHALPSFPGKHALVSAGGIVFGLLGLLAAQLIGLLWIFRRRGLCVGAGQAWLLSVLATSVIFSLILSEPGTVSGMYFLTYGLAAGVPLAGAGLRMAWLGRPSLSGGWLRVATLGLAWLVFLVVLLVVPLHAHLFSGPRSLAHTYLLWYGGVLLSLVALYALAKAWIGPTRWAAAALCCGAVVVIGALDTPIDSVVPALAHPGKVSVSFFEPMTSDMYEALTWVRRHTPAGAVIAVNNQWIDRAHLSPLEFDYSAFAERRVFLEGWGYSQRTIELGYGKRGSVPNPFAGRLSLNVAAFVHGDRQAVSTMAKRYRVRYLVVDGRNGYPADLQALDRLGRRAFSAPGAVVIELR